MKFRPVTLERRIIPLIILLLCLLLIIPVIIVSLTTRPAQDGGVSLEKSGQAHTINVFVTAENKVKAMDLEDYITSVVAGEMPATYYPEALKAQACAARTFAVSRMESGGCNRAKNADVCTDSGHCQAYVSPEKMKSNWGGEYVTKYNKVKDAVQETQGDVIIYEGKPISALYSPPPEVIRRIPKTYSPAPSRISGRSKAMVRKPSRPVSTARCGYPTGISRRNSRASTAASISPRATLKIPSPSSSVRIPAG